MHWLFYTDTAVYEDEYHACRARLMPIAYADRDDARGGVAWEIETDGGGTFGRWQIVRLIEYRAADLVGRPRGR